MFWNKNLLAVGDDSSPELQKKSEAFANVFGALYDAYEPRYWWFEAVIMIQKAMLTGGLVLIAPGRIASGGVYANVSFPLTIVVTLFTRTDTNAFFSCPGGVKHWSDVPMNLVCWHAEPPTVTTGTYSDEPRCLPSMMIHSLPYHRASEGSTLVTVED